MEEEEDEEEDEEERGGGGGGGGGATEDKTITIEDPLASKRPLLLIRRKSLPCSREWERTRKSSRHGHKTKDEALPQQLPPPVYAAES